MTREERKIQREIDFTDWWLREHKMEGIPTYADAIEWADEHPCMSEEEQVGMEGLGMVWQKKHLINKAIDVLVDLSNDGHLIDIHNYEEFEKQFIKKMEE